MPLKKLDPNEWKVGIRRTLVVGGPNTRKTSSLVTWPKPIHVIGFPGEKGMVSLPLTEGVHAYVYEHEAGQPAESPAKVLKDIRQTTIDILSGKYGECKTFAGDGIHKLYEVFLDDVSDGASSKGEEFEAKLYSQSHAGFLDYLKLVLQSTVPYAVFTVWDGTEILDPLGLNTKNKALYPDLPGKLAKRIMGEFPVVLYADVGISTAPGVPAPASWRLVPNALVRGCGAKIPAAIAKQLPPVVPQDWARLEPILLGDVVVRPSQPQPPVKG